MSSPQTNHHLLSARHHVRGVYKDLRRPAGTVLIAGLALSAAGLVLAYGLRDSSRRRQVSRGLASVLRRAWRGPFRDDQDLKGQVVRAIKAKRGLPKGLRIGVQGRTVYLRGRVADPAAADGAVESAHSVAGVQAVVNNITAADR